MKKLSLAASTAILLAAASTARAGDYKNERLGVELKQPKGWKVEGKPDDGFGTLALFPGVSRSGITISAAPCSSARPCSRRPKRRRRFSARWLIRRSKTGFRLTRPK